MSGLFAYQTEVNHKRKSFYPLAPPIRKRRAQIISNIKSLNVLPAPSCPKSSSACKSGIEKKKKKSSKSRECGYICTFQTLFVFHRVAAS